MKKAATWFLAAVLLTTTGCASAIWGTTYWRKDAKSQIRIWSVSDNYHKLSKNVWVIVSNPSGDSKSFDINCFFQDDPTVPGATATLLVKGLSDAYAKVELPISLARQQGFVNDEEANRIICEFREQPSGSSLKSVEW